MKYICKILLILILTQPLATSLIKAEDERSCCCLPPTASAPTIPVVYFGDLTNSDDVLALFLILKDPRIDLLAVYIVGNAFGDAGATMQYVINMLDWLGRTNVPVVIGSAYATIDTFPAIPPLDETWGAAVPKGSNGKFLMDSLWGLSGLLPQSPRHYQPITSSSNGFEDDIAAINTIRAIIAGSPTPVNILSFGSLTGPYNVLQGQTFPNFPAPIVVPPAPANVLTNIASFLQMGGDLNLSGTTVGNVLFFFPEICRSEFNIFADPTAAEVVFTLLAANSIPITLVPLDATDTVPAAQFITLLNATQAVTPEFVFIRKLYNQVAQNWFSFTFGLVGLFIWDATAAMAFLDPSVIATSQNSNVTVTSSTTLTKIVAPPGGCNTPVEGSCPEVPCAITITRTYTSSTGQTNINPAGNPMFVVTSFNTPQIYNSIITRLNTKNANSARVALKEPIGLYQYVPASA